MEVPKQTYASPMSFVGSGRRLSGWARRKQGAGRVLAWAAVLLAAVPFFWTFLLAWYLVAWELLT